MCYQQIRFKALKTFASKNSSNKVFIYLKTSTKFSKCKNEKNGHKTLLFTSIEVKKNFEQLLITIYKIMALIYLYHNVLFLNDKIKAQLGFKVNEIY